MARWVGLFSGVVMLAACGGGSMSMAEYTEEVADVLERVDTRLQASGDRLMSGPRDMSATRAYLADRVSGYEEMIDGIGGLDPPEDAREIHDVFVGLLDELLTAETSRADFAATLAESDDPGLVWNSAQSAAIDEAEQKAIEICHLAQDMVDETQEREELADLPWIPPEMKEVVRTAFGCPGSEEG